MEPDPYQPLLTIFESIHFLQITSGVIVSAIITVILLIGSAFISGSEVAFFALTPTDREAFANSKNHSKMRALKLLDNPNNLLGTILIANNFINVGIVILSSYTLNSLIDFSASPTVGFLVQVVVITFLLLLFGEILPKIYANSHAPQFATRMAYPLKVISSIFHPLVLILIKSSNVVTKKLANKRQAVSREELSTVLELASDGIPEDKDILEGIIKFGNISVADIMVSRVEVIDIDIKSSYNKVISIIIESGYSRIPVFSEGPDNVKGILYIKDLLPHLHKGENFRWQSLIRPAYYVPETKKINDLLEEFQTNKIHMAVVIDEYGGTAGIVTLEDILEEIVGEINDEYDEDDFQYIKNADGSWELEGRMSIIDFLRITELDESLLGNAKEEAESVAGLLLATKGDIPEKQEEIMIGNLKFTVLAVDQRRIKKIKLEILNK